MDPRKLQESFGEEEGGGDEVILHKKKICIHVFAEFNDVYRELKDMPSIKEGELAEGIYWVIYAEDATVYLLHEGTRCLKRVQLADYFRNIFMDLSLRYLLFLNIWPLIRVTKSGGARLLKIAKLSELTFKDLHKWKIQNSTPFAFYRLVHTEQNEEEGELTQCNIKSGMFRGLETPRLSQFPLNTVVYIVGPVVNSDPKTPSYMEDFIVVVEKQQPRDIIDGVANKSPTHDAHLLRFTDKLYDLLNNIPLNEICSGHSYYHFLGGDYVVKVQLNENGEKMIQNIVPLKDFCLILLS